MTAANLVIAASDVIATSDVSQYSGTGTGVGGAPGDGLGRESGEAMRWLRVFPGALVQVAEVRGFVACLLAGCPAREVLVTCASELSANAIVHTASGRGGFFSVEVVRCRDGVARVAVTDAGGAGVPAARAAGRRGPGAAGGTGVRDGSGALSALDALEESGRGLAMVAACTSRWGYTDAGAGVGTGRTVWAEATWPVPVPGDNKPGDKKPSDNKTPRQSCTGVPSRGWRGRDGAALSTRRGRRAVPSNRGRGQLPAAARSSPAPPSRTSPDLLQDPRGTAPPSC
jgi:anti-sigma regulatory factor (Ser/Thr protein kinase)